MIQSFITHRVYVGSVMSEAPDYGDENSTLMEEIAKEAPYARRYKGEFE